MSDTHCLVCSEPWDIYGLAHGDVKAWEADCIRRGFGCPACKGGELGLNYKPEEDRISIGHCTDCDRSHYIDVNEVYYDGSQKIIYHNSGNVNLSNLDDVMRYLEIEEDWGCVDEDIKCKHCMENYTLCNGCNDWVSTDDCYNVDCESFCEDCYCELFERCENCDNDIDRNNTVWFDDMCWCEPCLKEKTEECEICGECFYKEALIEGKNGEHCCSEKCADETADI